MRIDRSRQTENHINLDLSDADPLQGSAAFLAVTASMGKYPNTAMTTYAIHLVTVDVAETEGATPTFTTGTETLYALNLGSNVPNTGTYLVVHGVGGRLAFCTS